MFDPFEALPGKSLMKKGLWEYFYDRGSGRGLGYVARRIKDMNPGTWAGVLLGDEIERADGEERGV